MTRTLTLLVILMYLLILNSLFAQGHNAGSNCLACHPQFKVGGTVLSNITGTTTLSGVALKLV